MDRVSVETRDRVAGSNHLTEKNPVVCARVPTDL